MTNFFRSLDDRSDEGRKDHIKERTNCFGRPLQKDAPALAVKQIRRTVASNASRGRGRDVRIRGGVKGGGSKDGAST